MNTITLVIFRAAAIANTIGSMLPYGMYSSTDHLINFKTAYEGLLKELEKDLLTLSCLIEKEIHK